MILQRRKQHDISIHSLHTEGDLLCSWHCIDRTNISIHSLHTEGDVSGYSLAVVAYSFQSTPSTRRETNDLAESEHDNEISIHSLHTEGDAELTAMAAEASQNFNPLPPHGGRQQKIQQIKIQLTFQSTPSTRRETFWNSNHDIYFSYFNPLPPHGGRLQNCFQLFTFSLISIHSLHTEGDTGQAVTLKIRTEFQSTPSTRRETRIMSPEELQAVISIHSLHTEGDGAEKYRNCDDFIFQSTPSTRRETSLMQLLM